MASVHMAVYRCPELDRTCYIHAAMPSQAPRAGYYGPFGGRFVAETLVPALDELARACETIVPSEAFQREWRGLLATYVGRPTPLGEAQRLARAIDPEGRTLARLWLKREDLCHTGSHKINNALGQVLLAKKMGKTRIIAETGAGQHGVATATACALFDLPCEVYMGAEDVKRQAPNVGRMALLGAKVVPVESGSRTLKDAMNEALRDWVTNVRTTHYCIGSAAGPAPVPRARRLAPERHRRRGARADPRSRRARFPTPRWPASAAGRTRSASSAGSCATRTSRSSASKRRARASPPGVTRRRSTKGRVGVLHGSKSYVLCDDGGQIMEAHSISAGLDYPGVGPEHSWLKESGRATYLLGDRRRGARRGARRSRAREGILVALETAHAFARVGDVARDLAASRGRPVSIVARALGPRRQGPGDAARAPAFRQAGCAS